MSAREAPICTDSAPICTDSAERVKYALIFDWFYTKVNALNLLFLTPIVILGLTAAIHATAYLHGEARQHLPRFWFFFLTTLAAMAGVVLSPDKLTFLLAWEAMGLASAGLVAFENTEKQVRKATWIYFLACHAGACALMLAGVLLNKPGCTLAAFICAVVGFGLKIGFPPFHIWLPEAHPAAPAPASAIMSGAMIPLGFYGLIRFVTPWGQTPQIWGQTPEMYAISGWILLILGIFGALGGILFALPQVNLKKLLAFSSVENMGVITMGLGLALLGTGPECINPVPLHPARQSPTTFRGVSHSDPQTPLRPPCANLAANQ